MNEWRVLAWFWRVCGGGDDDGGDGGDAGTHEPTCPLQRSQRRKRTRSVEDDEEGHLIYHNGDMLRARCIEHIPFSLYLFFCFVSCIVVG